MKALEKRMVALERRTRDYPFVVILNTLGEARDAVVRHWERDNGPLDMRQAIVVNFVDAAL